MSTPHLPGMGEPEKRALTQKERAAWGKAARERTSLERAQLLARLAREGATDLTTKLEKCGTPVGLVCTNCGTRKIVELQCKRRWCPSCAWSIGEERMTRFRMAVDLMRWPLFVTLTLPNDPDPEIIRTLRSAWGRMRRRKLMQDRVTGGISTIEVTQGEGGWHPHLHIIANCEWLAIHTPKPHWSDSAAVKQQKYDHAAQELTAIWSDVIKTPTSIIKIKRLKSLDIVRYVLKYAVKGSDLVESTLPIAPLIRVLSKSRLLSAFGDLHGAIPQEQDDNQPITVCPCCAAEKSWYPEELAHVIVNPEDRVGARYPVHLRNRRAS